MTEEGECKHPKIPTNERLKILSPRAEVRVKEPCVMKDKTKLTEQLTSVLLV